MIGCGQSDESDHELMFKQRPLSINAALNVFGSEQRKENFSNILMQIIIEAITKQTAGFRQTLQDILRNVMCLIGWCVNRKLIVTTVADNLIPLIFWIPVKG